MAKARPKKKPRYNSPFPWWGSKARHAHKIWPYIGQIDNYVEPFAGTAAMLFLRPEESKNPKRHPIETLNDVDSYLVNFWRAIKHDPEQVAHYADHPVIEADLHATHHWLVFNTQEFQERYHRDPDHYCPKIAGLWVWGLSAWIGGGWCTDYGSTEAGKSRKQTIPFLQGAGKGVHRPELSEKNEQVLNKLMELVRSGDLTEESRAKILTKLNGDSSPLALEIKDLLDPVQLVQHRIPYLTGHGQGVHRPVQEVPEFETPQKIPQLGRHQGLHRWEFGKRTDLYDYFAAICARLRYVRITNGSWKRVLTPAVTTYHGITGVFLDPPYSSQRENPRELFAHDDEQIAHDVRAWCAKNGDNPEFRICLTGHGHEHVELEGLGWVRVPLGGTSGYCHGFENSEAGKLAKTESAWFSPHCVNLPVASTPHLAG